MYDGGDCDAGIAGGTREDENACSRDGGTAGTESWSDSDNTTSIATLMTPIFVLLNHSCIINVCSIVSGSHPPTPVPPFKQIGIN